MTGLFRYVPQIEQVALDVDPAVLQLLAERDRQLEDYLSNLSASGVAMYRASMPGSSSQALTTSWAALTDCDIDFSCAVTSKVYLVSSVTLRGTATGWSEAFTDLLVDGSIAFGYNTADWGDSGAADQLVTLPNTAMEEVAAGDHTATLNVKKLVNAGTVSAGGASVVAWVVAV